MVKHIDHCLHWHKLHSCQFHVSGTCSQTAENQVTDSHVTESQATESQATESQATESQATESQATESHATESHVTQSQVTRRQVTQSQVTQSQVTESHVTESQSCEIEVAAKSHKERQPTLINGKLVCLYKQLFFTFLLPSGHVKTMKWLKLQSQVQNKIV